MANIISNAGTIHYDRILMNYAADYQPQEYKFINQFLLPSVPVIKQSDKYAMFSAKGRYNIKNSTRAKGTKSNKIETYFLSDDSFYCDEKSLSEDIFWQDIANADLQGEEKSKVRNVMAALKLEEEFNASALVFDAANYSSSSKVAVAAGNRWSEDDYQTNDPRKMIQDYKLTISNRIGIEPNTLVFNKTAANGLMRNPYIQAYMSANVDKDITTIVLAKYFDVDRVLIGSGAYNTAKEGQTISMSAIWGKNALLCYVKPDAGLTDPSFAKKFVWNMPNRGLIGARKFDDEARKMTTVEAEINYDQKITFEASAILLTDVIA